jgi:hypothetical protein
MKNDRSSMCVGITDNGCSANPCFDAAVFPLFVSSLPLPRGTAVVEANRTVNVSRLLPSPFRVIAAHFKFCPPNRGCSIIILMALVMRVEES